MLLVGDRWPLAVGRFVAGVGLAIAGFFADRSNHYAGTVVWSFAALLIGSGALEPVARVLRRKKWEPFAIQTLRASALQLEDLCTCFARLTGRDDVFDRPGLFHPSPQALDRMRGDLLGHLSDAPWQDADRPPSEMERQLEHLLEVLWPRLVEALDDAELTFALGRLEDVFRHWRRDGQEHAADCATRLVDVYARLLSHRKLIEKQPIIGQR